MTTPELTTTIERIFSTLVQTSRRKEMEFISVKNDKYDAFNLKLLGLSNVLKTFLCCPSL